jgi:hypothetical protein
MARGASTFFEENDGAAQLTIFVNDVQIDSLAWKQNLASARACTAAADPAWRRALARPGAPT